MQSELQKRVQFIETLDRLKNVLRQNLLMDGSRRENSGEHSWLLATSVYIFKDSANVPINVERTMAMALIHDIVEIYAGDAIVYDNVANASKFERESEAIAKLTALLPSPQGEEVKSLWLEYEEQVTSEAQYLYALDRLLPILANSKTNWHTWRLHKISKEQVLSKVSEVPKIAPQIYEFMMKMVDDAVAAGALVP